jgi:hypothetical protein
MMSVIDAELTELGVIVQIHLLAPSLDAPVGNARRERHQPVEFHCALIVSRGPADSSLANVMLRQESLELEPRDYPRRNSGGALQPVLDPVTVSRIRKKISPTLVEKETRQPSENQLVQ